MVNFFQFSSPLPFLPKYTTAKKDQSLNRNSHLHHMLSLPTIRNPRTIYQIRQYNTLNYTVTDITQGVVT
jgi:hypothetical protein